MLGNRIERDAKNKNGKGGKERGVDLTRLRVTYDGLNNNVNPNHPPPKQPPLGGGHRTHLPLKVEGG